MAGMLTLKELQQAVSAGEIDTVEIDVVAALSLLDVLGIEVGTAHMSTL